MAIEVSDSDVRKTLRSINKALDEISDADERKRINKIGGKLVQNAARALAPRSRKPHYVYRTPKAMKGQRAKRGSAKKYRVKYLPGNLAKSIRVLNLRRAVNAVIGPRILRNPRASVYGRNERNVNAFYAQFIYGSAKAFRNRVMAPALSAQSARVKKVIGREVEKLKRAAAQKNGLD